MEEREKEKENPEFDITDMGYNVRAWYLKDTTIEKGEAIIEIRKDENLIQKFIFPAYKIWNIAAHFKDIIDSEEKKNVEGYQIAASTGL